MTPNGASMETGEPSHVNIINARFDRRYGVTVRAVDVPPCRPRQIPLVRYLVAKCDHAICAAENHTVVFGRSGAFGEVGTNVLVLVVLLAAVLTTVGLITCVVTHYHHSHHLHHHQSQSTEETTTCSLATAQLIFNNSSNLRNSSKFNATTVPMLALEASMERERCALHDRQVRLHSVHTDLGLDLPTSIHLPDGEEMPYGSSTRLHIRDAEQESEIYRKCIRPPPNRTIEQSETILPYRSSSTGLLSLSSSSSNNSSNEWGQNVVRCHSMSSRYTAAVVPPSVIIPTASNARHHHQHHQHHYNNHHKVSAGLAKIQMVPCLTDHRSSPTTVGGGGEGSSPASAAPEVPCTTADTTSSKCLSSSSSTSSCCTSSSKSSSSLSSASSGTSGTTSSTVSRLSTSTSLTIGPTSFVRQL